MNTIFNPVISILFLLGSRYVAKEVMFTVEKGAVKRISEGFSKSEPFAQKLMGTKLPF